VHEAMIAAMVRLDWREARHQAEVLQAMGAGKQGPMSEAEQADLVARFTRLIDEAKARVAARLRLIDEAEASGIGPQPWLRELYQFGIKAKCPSALRTPLICSSTASPSCSQSELLQPCRAGRHGTALPPAVVPLAESSGI